MKKNIIFFNTHPIQYFAPLYQEIEKDGHFDLEVWYGTKHGLEGEIDKQFGTSVKWDIPILEGYKHKFLQNNSWKPGLYNGFWGVMNLSVWKELRQLPKKSIVVIHGWTPFTAIYAILCSKLQGHITCLRAESPFVHESGRSKSSLMMRTIFLKHFLFRFIDKFLYIGKQNRLFYLHYGVKESQLIFTPYAVNNVRFQQHAKELLPKKEELRQELGIPLSSQVILYSGKLISKKRPLDLLKAFSQLPNDINAFLVFVGDGELRKDLETFINEHNVQNVLITGFINQSQIPKYYAIADVFVMCSDVGETWGLSTNEAMNFGLPILISDRTGNHSDLVDGNGFVFETGNVVELSNNIKVIINDNNFRIGAGKKSLEIIQNFTYQKIVDNILKAELSNE